jgi:RHS repeat-associated protein
VAPRWPRRHIRTVTDADGAPLESRLYTPYGEPLSSTGTPQTIFGFTGEPTDANGLVYLRARYYNPALGVFPTLDPMEDGNRYAWVGGNVVNRVDPSGMIGERPEKWDRCQGLQSQDCSCFHSDYLRELCQQGLLGTAPCSSNTKSSCNLRATSLDPKTLAARVSEFICKSSESEVNNCIGIGILFINTLDDQAGKNPREGQWVSFSGVLGSVAPGCLP